MDFTLTKRDKRIVIEHTSGRLAGLHSIAGLESELTGLPEFVEDVDMQDHTASASLVAVKRSHVLYRELIEPVNSNQKHFDRGQR